MTAYTFIIYTAHHLSKLKLEQQSGCCQGGEKGGKVEKYFAVT